MRSQMSDTRSALFLQLQTLLAAWPLRSMVLQPGNSFPQLSELYASFCSNVTLAERLHSKIALPHPNFLFLTVFSFNSQVLPPHDIIYLCV